ncbi:MAG: hypothetical protein JXR64_07810, partial [Spirochaetales bacterium]|nr:hypothetical protein [Spirochaetales bacterium]
MKIKNSLLPVIISIFALILTVVISTTVGYAHITIGQTIKILLNTIHPFFIIPDLPINAEINILYVRFPRILGAGLAGMGLSLS